MKNYRRNRGLLHPLMYDCSAIINRQDLLKDLEQKYQNGDKIARNTLIVDYINHHEEKKAVPLLKEAIQDGTTYFYTDLAIIYFFGDDGVKQDYTEALRLFKLGWDNNSDSTAAMFIAFSYDCGWGTKRDILEAIEWYKISVRMNVSEAFPILASIYAYGAKDFPPDIEEAKKWIEKGLASGDEEAIAETEAIKKDIEDSLNK